MSPPISVHGGRSSSSSNSSSSSRIGKLLIRSIALFGNSAGENRQNSSPVGKIVLPIMLIPLKFAKAMSSSASAGAVTIRICKLRLCCVTFVLAIVTWWRYFGLNIVYISFNAASTSRSRRFGFWKCSLLKGGTTFMRIIFWALATGEALPLTVFTKRGHSSRRFWA